MANPLFQQFGQPQNSGIMQQVEQMRSTLKQDPREIVQGLLNSGQMSQQQFNMLAQQANQIMSQMRGNK
jgi:hypothetical protein